MRFLFLFQYCIQLCFVFTHTRTQARCYCSCICIHTHTHTHVFVIVFVFAFVLIAPDSTQLHFSILFLNLPRSHYLNNSTKGNRRKGAGWEDRDRENELQTRSKKESCLLPLAKSITPLFLHSFDKLDTHIFAHTHIFTHTLTCFLGLRIPFLLLKQRRCTTRLA